MSAILEIDLAISLRYLKALSELAPSHSFARALLVELSHKDVTVAEYIEPIHRAPMHALTPDEQLWRRTAERVQ